MTEDRASISSSRISAFDVSRGSFAVVKKGFDPREVRAFLESISHELQLGEEREQDLRRRISDANERAMHPVLDEETLTAALGQQSTQVLQTAHEQARSLLEGAQAQANELLQSAQLRASAGIVDAEQRAGARVGEAEAAATALEQEATVTAQQIIGQAQADGETLVARAREQGRLMIEQAQNARTRVLSDMNAKRRMMHVQIEQLRAARDELARSIIGVRETIDRLTDEISASDDAARAAAQEVARRQPTPEELAEDTSGILGNDGVESGGTSSDELALLENGTDLPESHVVEELFAKIRASAKSEAPRSSDAVPRARDANAVRSTPSSSDTAAVGARDGALSSPRSTLIRKIKRTMQDEQNRLLEALREGRNGDEILRLMDQQVSLIASAAVDPLGDAANAGKGFAHDHGVPTGSGLPRGAVSVIAESLGTQITSTLQRKLEEALRSDDPAAGMNAAFREWRGARLERVVGDAALEAFSAAIVISSGTGKVRWAVGSSDGPCPDCADNELEGPVVAGSLFPTGQAYPPAHAGCRCAVIPFLP